MVEKRIKWAYNNFRIHFRRAKSVPVRFKGAFFLSLELSRMCTAIAPSPTLAIDAKAKEMRLNGRDVVSFSVGEPDFVTPQYIRTAAHEALDMGLTKYTPAPGTIGLRKAICEKLMRDNGLAYTPEQIVVSNGAKFSIYASLAAIVNPGDEVIIPTPCWVSYPEIVRIVGGVPVLVEGKAERGFVVDAEEIAPYVTEKTKALILNSPNNPNGCVWKREQLEAIAKLAVEKGFYVVSDEIYEKLIYDGEEHVSIASLGKEIYNQTIVINGVSKSYAMTGWRIGYTAGPLNVIKAMSSLQSQVASGSNSIAQYAAEEALRSPKGAAEIERMRKAYDERRQHIVARLNAIDGLKCVMPKGAFYVMVNLEKTIRKQIDGQTIHNGDDFAKLLLEKSLVAVVPGIGFGAPNFMRLSYAISTENIVTGMDRLEAFLNRLQ